MSDGIFGVIATSMLLLLLGAGISYSSGRQSMQKEAVLMGHGVWSADKDGSATFQWKEAKP